MYNESQMEGRRELGKGAMETEQGQKWHQIEARRKRKLKPEFINLDSGSKEI